jgi:hypothetical protein
MSDNHAQSELLFSYGTLQLESVQLATFGRLLAGASDVLHGYALGKLKIDDATVVAKSGQTHHAIIRFTGRPTDVVSGMAFAISAQELLGADAYEVAAYKRTGVTLQSGLRAWVYVDATDA